MMQLHYPESLHLINKKMSEKFNATEVTVEELRSFKGLNDLSEHEALEVIQAIEQFAALTFELIGKTEERNS